MLRGRFLVGDRTGGKLKLGGSSRCVFPISLLAHRTFYPWGKGSCSLFENRLENPLGKLGGRTNFSCPRSARLRRRSTLLP